MEIEYGYCSFCKRTDVPICPGCGGLCPHGDTPGTWLPCHCGGMDQASTDQFMANVLLEYNKRKEVKKDED